MRINKVKGFTLIELLAVIIILAIIAFISTSLILSVIKNAQPKSKETGALGLIEAANNYYAKSLTSPATYPINPTTSILNNLSYTGEKPEEYTDIGYGVYLNSNKEVALAVSYSGTCYQKGYKDTTIRTFIYDSSTCVALSRTESTLNGADPTYEKGLIPIVYDEITASPTYRKWVKADIYSTTNTWYDYANKKWANAVMVTNAKRNAYVAAAPGTEILEADILAYLVWIPRYEYKYTEMVVANAISINFISKTTTTPSDAANYKVHPAFTFGDEELSGIWVGKFETTGTGNSPTVKPNLVALGTQDISTEFKTSQKFNTYGLGSSNDAHMMKDSEWGAAAYISHSVYGICTNQTTCSEIYINNSSNFITGRSGGAVGGSTARVSTQYPTSGSTSHNRFYDYGYYTYDGKIVEYGGAINAYSSTITLGTKASTTGNIYGIYDMSGGTWENLMGVYSSVAYNNGYPGYSGDSAAYNSGYNGWLSTDNIIKTDGKSWPTNKYYEIFTSASSAIACSGGICYGYALSETASWYNDDASMVTESYPWLCRGGSYSDSTFSGLFSFNASRGYAYSVFSFRLVVS